MLLERNDMEGILRELYEPTSMGQLTWVADGDALSMALPSRLIVSLLRKPGGELTATVERAGAEVLGTLEAAEGTRATVTDLYRVAKASARRNVYEEVVLAIKLGIQDRAAFATPVVNPEFSDRIRHAMKGRWSVELGPNKEVATIDADGNYRIDGRGDKPVFRLVILATNPDGTTADIAKDLSDGRRRQIERLTLTGNTLSGRVLIDEREIRYTRLP